MDKLSTLYNTFNTYKYVCDLMEQRIKIEWNQHLKLCSIEEDEIGILGFLWFLRERYE